MIKTGILFDNLSHVDDNLTTKGKYVMSISRDSEHVTFIKASYAIALRCILLAHSQDKANGIMTREYPSFTTQDTNSCFFFPLVSIS